MPFWYTPTQLRHITAGRDVRRGGGSGCAVEVPNCEGAVVCCRHKLTFVTRPLHTGDGTSVGSPACHSFAVVPQVEDLQHNVPLGDQPSECCRLRGNLGVYGQSAGGSLQMGCRLTQRNQRQQQSRIRLRLVQVKVESYASTFYGGYPHICLILRTLSGTTVTGDPDPNPITPPRPPPKDGVQCPMVGR